MTAKRDSDQGPDDPGPVRSDVTGSDPVMVQCKGYRCMAYHDGKGRWVNFFTREVLDDFIRVVE